MSTPITSFLTEDHARCDELFAQMEEAAHGGDGKALGALFASFRQATLRHLRVEEDVLFPALEAEAGPLPPVRVMLAEHAQMRGLLDELAAAAEQGDTDELTGLAQTLLVVMEQHNLKEQNILYPMADQALAPRASALLDTMRAFPAGAS
jgi:iron-sulfur cluster repair protein YtfE (RIC family)